MSAASVRQCVEMHRWFAEQVVSRPDAFGIDLLEEILFCDDWSAECLWKNLALLDDLLEKAPDREYRAAGGVGRRKNAGALFPPDRDADGPCV